MSCPKYLERPHEWPRSHNYSHGLDICDVESCMWAPRRDMYETIAEQAVPNFPHRSKRQKRYETQETQDTECSAIKSHHCFRLMHMLSITYH